MSKNQEILSRAQLENPQNVPTLDSIAPRNVPSIGIEEILPQLRNPGNILLIDVRSEAEFEDSHLPGAISFPILNNEERHEVGLIYKQVSPEIATKRALEFGAPKIPRLVERVRRESRPVFIYCWRGGGRSRYVAARLVEAGLKVRKIDDGHKAWRQRVYRHLYQEEFPAITILKGITGCGKSRVLDVLSRQVACLHLEEYAQNTASSFGRIPYQLRGTIRHVSQKSFEDCIYRDAFLNPLPTLKYGLLTESESRRVGSANLPPMLYQNMLNAPTIELTCSTEMRVQRIFEDYVGEEGRGIPLIHKCLDSLKPYVERSQLQTWQNMVEQDQIRALLRSLLVDYYDVRYKGLYRPAEFVVDTESIDDAVSQILQIMSR